MDIRYYKEQHHNYMVIRRTEDESVVGYQQKMLSGHRMEYIIPSRLRSVDGNEYNYYDITSKLTLRQMFGSRLFDLEDIRRLMSAIRAACEEVDRYLLDIRRLCLDPDLIFYSYARGRYSFLYNISTDVEDSMSGIGAFMDYLLERVSPDDSEASDLVYRMYEVYEKADFDVWDAVLLAEESSDPESRPESGDSLSEKSAISYLPADSSAGITSGSDAVYDSVYEGLEHISDGISGEDASASGTGRRQSHAFRYILMALGAAGLAACALIYFFIYLNEDELMLLIAGGGAAAAGLIAGIILLVRSKVAGARKIRERERIYAEDDLYASEHYSAMPAIHMEEFLSRPGSGPRRRPVRQSGGDTYDEAYSGSLQEETPDDSGQTVFFDEMLGSGSYKLYAMDRKNKQHIELDSFPCTIGKLKGYVDCCIDHPSISRVHARIEKKDGALLLRDSNSTNGTWINGIRLAPNEQRIIEVGDEIRFGNLNYALRPAGADST
ncbi:MAG: FHA domain-containing protein [Lachnospiraceae bacterium]|nr:FHA domain-containing protein [Lachnospiraceae bacterium]